MDALLAKLVVASIKAIPGSPSLADLATSLASTKSAAKLGGKDAKACQVRCWVLALMLQAES